MNFNREQQQAVSHKDGALLVLAGPGSGKTAVITHRTQKLITEYQVAPSSILVVTFTKAAARQMRERFLRLTGESVTQVTFGTFHGVFYGILRQAYGITSANIASEDDRYRILRDLIQKTSMDVDDENDLLESLNREISTVKSGRIPLTHYYSASCPDEEFRRIYESYEKRLHGQRLLDFDDLMVYCYQLFQKHPEILAAWQKKFRYILIDEFQDVNQLQYDIIKLLALPENNLFLVGDDDQSIYRFRGAKPEIMLHVPKDYPGMKQIVLQQNYRCSGEIVAKSQNLIRWNDARFEKQLRTENERGRAIEIRSFENESEETTWLARQIQRDLAEGCPYREIAVLFRTNVGSRMTVERMMEYNFPFTMRDVLPNLYEHWLAKNMVSYMRLAMGSRQRRDFLAVMNRPNRYLSRDAFYEKEMPFEILYQFYEGKEWMCDRIEKFEHDLKMMKNMTPYAAINYIRYGIGYDEYLKEYAQYRRIKVEELYDILREIQESSKGYRTYQEWFDYMEEYKEKLKEQAEKIRQEREAVTISTLHSVKGLEFDRVYILDVNEGSIPYHKAVLNTEMEEERRMFYVGMTRARKELHLYSVQERFGKKMEPSRFLAEIEEAPGKRKGNPLQMKENKIVIGWVKLQKMDGNKGERPGETGRRILREILRKEYGIDISCEQEPIIRETGGKPILALHREIHFNISHSGKYVVCSVGSEPMGIDIQYHKEGDHRKMARRIMTEEEWEIYASSGFCEDIFFRYWTKKESFLKYTGEGIRREMGALSYEKCRFYELNLWKGYSGMLCVAEEWQGKIVQCAFSG